MHLHTAQPTVSTARFTYTPMQGRQKIMQLLYDKMHGMHANVYGHHARPLPPRSAARVS